LAPQFIAAVQCHWCSKFRPAFRTHRLLSNQVICDNCLDWHAHALEFLGGHLPAGCQRCQRTWAQLRDEIPGVEVRMYVVPRDGIYQLLCAACVKPYLPKQAGLFRGTKFGKETLKL
jgi:hypothetical protein